MNLLKTILFIFFLILSVQVGFSQKDNQLLRDKSDCFSEKQIDLTSTTLPSNYRGNNLQKILSELIRKETLTKDEFETSKQFLERVENENQKNYVGELNAKSLFAFQIKQGTFRYDADNELMNFYMTLSPTESWTETCPNNQYGVIEKNENISITSLNKQHISLNLDFKIGLEKAKVTKQNLKVIFIGKIQNIAEKFYSKSSKNKFSIAENIYLNFSLEEIWIYDLTTGEIFLKYKPNFEELLELERKKNEIDSGEFQNVKILFESGKYDEALKFLREILVTSPMEARAYFWLGKIHFQQEEIDLAISSFKTALFWNNNLIDAYLMLVRIFLKTNNCTQAETYLFSAKEIDSNNAEINTLQEQINLTCTDTEKVKIVNFGYSRNSNNKSSISNEIKDIGSLVEFATLRINPIYPTEAKRKKQSGVVKIIIVVDEKGDVESVINSSGPELLQTAAIEAIKKWKFKPYIIDGKAIKITGFVNFNFNL